jgi:toxin ParE1/3/4
MKLYRLSLLAEDDIAGILTISEERWGAEGRRRYAAILSAAMRRIAANPTGPTTRDRAELAVGLRSFHIRNARITDPNVNVRSPVHVLYYRAITTDLVEIVRVLHERMEPSLHFNSDNAD